MYLTFLTVFPVIFFMFCWCLFIYLFYLASSSSHVAQCYDMSALGHSFVNLHPVIELTQGISVFVLPFLKRIYKKKIKNWSTFYVNPCNVCLLFSFFPLALQCEQLCRNNGAIILIRRCSTTTSNIEIKLVFPILKRSAIVNNHDRHRQITQTLF